MDPPSRPPARAASLRAPRTPGWNRCRTPRAAHPSQDPPEALWPKSPRARLHGSSSASARNSGPRRSSRGAGVEGERGRRAPRHRPRPSATVPRAGLATLAERDRTQAPSVPTPASRNRQRGAAESCWTVRRRRSRGTTWRRARALLHEDAVMTMPPFDLWLRGTPDITGFMTTIGAACAGSRLVPVGGSTAPRASRTTSPTRGVRLRAVGGAGHRRPGRGDLGDALLPGRGALVPAVRPAPLAPPRRRR